MSEVIEYRKLDENNINCIVEKYITYYNFNENGSWTFDKAYKRIHQVMTIEDSHCIVQIVDGEISGFAMGYYKQFDDLLSYFLEEIVIFDGFQRQGFGSLMMKELEINVTNKGVEHIELLSVCDDLHNSFYSKLGYFDAKNLSLKGKHFKEAYIP